MPMSTASHTSLTMNQNCSEYSFPTPLNTDSLIMLAIINCGGGGVGVGGDGGEVGGSVGGGRNHEMRCLIKLNMLLGDTLARFSSLSREGVIKGLFSNSSLLL